MAKRGHSSSGGDTGDALDRVFERLAGDAAGLHDIAPPAVTLASGLPQPLIDLYGHCDGMRLFLETIEIAPSHGVEFEHGRWQFGAIDGDALAIDHRGRVWRADDSLDDDICDGTRLDRWLAGIYDATALLYDRDGEFAEDVFDDDGEVVVALRIRQYKAQLKRDPGAVGPRWRLAAALTEQGADETARDELEQVVADDPAFVWAWLDLARASERIGDLGNAIDEMRMAAETAEGVQHAHAGYFWSQLARLAVRSRNDVLRAEAATKVSLLAPGLKQAQIDGATASLAAGDHGSARGLCELLRAVWPRDLEVLELARRVEGN